MKTVDHRARRRRRAVVHPLPADDARPVGIASTGDAIWFVEIAAGQIGRMGLDFAVSEFGLGDRTAKPHAIAPAPSGDCWFTEWATNRVGRIAAAGAITEYAVPGSASEPHGIAVDDGGVVWVAMESGSVMRIGGGG